MTDQDTPRVHVLYHFAADHCGPQCSDAPTHDPDVVRAFLRGEHTGEVPHVRTQPGRGPLVSAGDRDRSPQRTGYLSPPQIRALDVACIPVLSIGTPYLVGSVNHRRDYRDVDVRLILEDDDPLLADEDRCASLNYVISEYLRAATGLPVDFQLQSMSEANGGDHPGVRNPLGTRWTRIARRR